MYDKTDACLDGHRVWYVRIMDTKTWLYKEILYFCKCHILLTDAHLNLNQF